MFEKEGFDGVQDALSVVIFCAIVKAGSDFGQVRCPVNVQSSRGFSIPICLAITDKRIAVPGLDSEEGFVTSFAPVGNTCAWS